MHVLQAMAVRLVCSALRPIAAIQTQDTVNLRVDHRVPRRA